MKKTIHLEKETQIYNAVSEFSPYMFIPLEKRGIRCSEYAQKLYQNGEVYVVEMDGEKAGIIAFYCNDFKNFKAYLTSIVVKDAYRKKGIGACLLTQMYECCLRHKMRNIGLDVCLNNSFAISFYEKHGFEIVGTDKELVYMEKNI